MELKEKAKKIIEILKKEYPTAHTELTYHKSRPYEFLFAVIMSAQTTDKQVNKVTDVLFEKYTSLEDYVKADPAEFAKDISSIGLYKGKAKNIQATAKILLEKYDGKVPATIEEIIELPGAARKTANVVTHELFGKNYGIAVDTHVRRLSQALGLSKNDDVKKIEKDLMAIIPQEEWGDFSRRLILYGRYHWTARSKEPVGPLAEVLK
jgi:endonuclease-3